MERKTRIWFWIAMLFLSIALLSGYFWYSMKNPNMVKPQKGYQEYEQILTTLEIQEWQTRKTLPGKAFIQIKNEIRVTDGDQAEIRLINPPYCGYIYHVSLYLLEDPERIIYQTDAMQPGTVLENVSLDFPLEPGEYKGQATFEFLDYKKKILGTHQVDLVFQVENNLPG